MRKKESFATIVKNLAVYRLGSVLYDVEKYLRMKGCTKIKCTKFISYSSARQAEWETAMRSVMQQVE